MRSRFHLGLLLLALFPLPLLGAESTPHRELASHDPSTIIKDNGEYWVFATGRGIVSRHSKDLQNWEAGPPVFTNAPAWTTNAVPGFRGVFWAPDLVRIHDRYLLYYSVSTMGSQTSAIGLATNVTLDPNDPHFHWTDCGIVIRSSPQKNFNTIDPSVLLDRAGKLWLAFGSFWSGIKVIALDPNSGRPLDTDSAPAAVAWKEAIEASCLYQHGDNYYLFVNWGHCCRGVESTYNIRVGRSRSAIGPFVDRAGKNLLGGGGTLLLESEGRFIGPGHAGLLEESGTTWLSFHYYDGLHHGTPRLGLRRLRWDAEGWPELLPGAQDK